MGCSVQINDNSGEMLVTTVDLWNLSRYIIIALGLLVILLCLSIVGQMFIDESTEVTKCAYETSWYDEPLEFQKMILLIMLRATKPLVLRSASISEISFQSFSKVTSSTYSYLTLLYKMLLASEEN